MAPDLDDAQIRRVAALARLNLTDDEVRTIGPQIARILDYVRQLEALTPDRVDPAADALSADEAARNDVPCSGLPAESALANAPQRRGEFFVVPSVLDRGSGA
jgi:aspartyl-tRNA(Asn)/glutamyl-tRNA(Gln) amidotransferase subunit C